MNEKKAWNRENKTKKNNRKEKKWKEEKKANWIAGREQECEDVWE